MEEGNALAQHHNAQSQGVHPHPVGQGCLGRRFDLDRVEEGLVVVRGNVDDILLRIGGVPGRRAVVTDVLSGDRITVDAGQLIVSEVTRQSESNPIGIVV